MADEADEALLQVVRLDRHEHDEQDDEERGADRAHQWLYVGLQDFDRRVPAALDDAHVERRLVPRRGGIFVRRCLRGGLLQILRKAIELSKHAIARGHDVANLCREIAAVGRQLVGQVV